MASVYKTKNDRSKKSSRWMIAWVDENGKRRTKRAYTDKLLSQRLARRLEDDARARRDGTVDVSAERIGEHARCPIADHLSDYRIYLEAKGNTSQYIDLTMARIRQAIDTTKWKTIADIDVAAISMYINVLRAGNRGLATINHHLRAVKSFTRWLLVNHRIVCDPLIGVQMLNANTDHRRDRRALEDDELARLIMVAHDNESVTITKRYRRKSGPDKGKIRIGNRTYHIPNRDLLYLLAVSTGLRLSELKSLTPQSFELDDDPPTVTVEASYSKHRRRDVQPMPAETAEALRPLISNTLPNNPLWPNLPSKMAQVIAFDLKAAGIPVYDDESRVVDFHALRHTFITRLTRSGITPKVTQVLARHSTITLTMDRYAHVVLADMSKALVSVPKIIVPDDQYTEVRTILATGTDDESCIKSQSEVTARNNGQEDILTMPWKFVREQNYLEEKSQRIEQRAETNTGQWVPSHVISETNNHCGSTAINDHRKFRLGRGLNASEHSVSLNVKTDEINEADGIRTRNLRIDSPGL